MPIFGGTKSIASFVTCSVASSENMRFLVGNLLVVVDIVVELGVEGRGLFEDRHRETGEGLPHCVFGFDGLALLDCAHV